jgi:hypothetical protein
LSLDKARQVDAEKIDMEEENISGCGDRRDGSE